MAKLVLSHSSAVFMPIFKAGASRYVKETLEVWVVDAHWVTRNRSPDASLNPAL